MISYNEFMRSLGLKISYYRKMKNMSSDTLAEIAGISSQHLRAIEAPNGKGAPSLQTLLQIANALEIPVYKLLKFD